MVTVTGIGSLPGVDFRAAVAMTFDRVPDLPYLPELPDRGPWAAMIGRSCALLPGIGVSLLAGRWRASSTPGVDQRRASVTLRDDVDVLEEMVHGYAGPFKVAFAGPWTLAAAIESPTTGRMLADPGARRDLAAAWAEGVSVFVADLHRRFPTMDVVLQVDEPSLPAVLGGRIATQGGLFRHRAIDRVEAAEAIAGIVSALNQRALVVTTVVHCCAPGFPVDLMMRRPPHGAGLDGVSVDLDALTRADWDAVAYAVEEGRSILLGALPTDARLASMTADAVAARVLRAVRPLELGPLVTERLILTPTCGLAGVPATAVPRVFDVLTTAARIVAEELSA